MRTFRAAFVLAAAAAAVPAVIAGPYPDGSVYELHFRQDHDPNTGRYTCVNEGYVKIPRAGIEYTEPFSCPGFCPWDELVQNYNFRWTGPNSGTLDNGRIASDNTCPVEYRKGTCMPSPSDACSYIGVGMQATSFGPNIQCRGSDINTCTWYTDENCNYIKPPGQPPVLYAGVDCQNQQGTDPTKWTGWCKTGYDVLFESKPNPCGGSGPAPPPPSASTRCVKSCSNGGNYILATVVDWKNRVVKCEGPNQFACTWYSDGNCDILVPPAMPPMSGGGIQCPANADVNQPNSWCAEATLQLLDNNEEAANCAQPPAPSECQVCINSCGDQGGSYFWGKRFPDGSVGCCGASPDICAWYYDSGCSIQIPPGKPPVANGGLKCPKDTSPGTGNWCQRVTGVMNAGSPPDAFCR